MNSEEELPRSEARYFGKGPIMTFMTAIVFGAEINVKFFLRTRWNSRAWISVVNARLAWKK